MIRMSARHLIRDQMSHTGYRKGCSLGCFETGTGSDTIQHECYCVLTLRWMKHRSVDAACLGMRVGRDGAKEHRPPDSRGPPQSIVKDFRDDEMMCEIHGVSQSPAQYSGASAVVGMLTFVIRARCRSTSSVGGAAENTELQCSNVRRARPQ